MNNRIYRDDSVSRRPLGVNPFKFNQIQGGAYKLPAFLSEGDNGGVSALEILGTSPAHDKAGLFRVRLVGGE